MVVDYHSPLNYIMKYPLTIQKLGLGKVCSYSFDTDSYHIEKQKQWRYYIFGKHEIPFLCMNYHLLPSIFYAEEALGYWVLYSHVCLGDGLMMQYLNSNSTLVVWSWIFVGFSYFGSTQAQLKWVVYANSYWNFFIYTHGDFPHTL